MVWRVAAILSGLWAKSSITVISLAVPTTSNRRRMPLNSSRCFAESARPTPHAIVALSAASALAMLCRPGTFSVTSTTSPLAREAAEEDAQLVERLVVEGDVVHHRDAGRKERDRTVALVDFANEFLPVT